MRPAPTDALSAVSSDAWSDAWSDDARSDDWSGSRRDVPPAPGAPLRRSSVGVRLARTWLLTALLAMLLGLLGAGRAGANPQLAPGGPAVGVPVAAQNPPTPSSGSLQGDAWSVLNPAGAVVATASAPNGWTLPSAYPYSAGTYPLQAPAGAATGAGYSLVFYYEQSYVGAFDVAAASPPAAPTNLTASAGDQYASLTWTAPAGTGLTYNVYRGTAAGGEGVTPVATGLTATAYVDTGLTDGMAYYYTVKAVNGAGPGSASGEASATPQAVAPSAPTNLSATAGNAQVSLSWTAPAGPGLTYNVFRGTASGGEGPSPVNASPLTAPSYTDAGLTQGTAYYYTVKAVNAHGTSPASNEASATPPTPPAAPAGLTAAMGSASVSLAWSAVSGATSYNVKRSTASGGPYTTVSAAGAVTGTTYYDGGLTNGTAYYYVVTAVGTGGEGAPSNQASATPTASGLASPSGLVATAYSATSVQLTWSPVTGATGYNLYRSTSPGGEGATPVASNLSTYYGAYSPYTDGGLTSGTTYYYQVTAVGGGGESGRSGEASATPGSSPLPAPTVKAVAGSGQVTLSWGAVAGASGYDVYRSTGTGGGTPALYQSGLTATTFADTGLANGTQYNYEVAAVGANGRGTLSGAVTAVPGSAPLPAALLSARATGTSGQVALTLNAPGGAFSSYNYNLYRSTTPGGEGSVPVGQIYYEYANGYGPYLDTGLTDGVTYYYTVAAAGPGGEGAMSAEASATPGSASLPAPTGLTVTTQSAGVFANALSWGAVSGASSYNLYRVVYPAGGAAPALLLYQTGLTGTSFQDTVLTTYGLNDAYAYAVAAVCAAGEGARSNPAGVTPSGFPMFPAPASLTVARGAVGAVNISVAEMGGFSGPVTLSGAGLPAGVSAWFYPSGSSQATVTPTAMSGLQADYMNGGGGSESPAPSPTPFGVVTGGLYLAVSASAAPGTYTIQVTGASGAATNGVTVTLTIQ